MSPTGSQSLLAKNKEFILFLTHLPPCERSKILSVVGGQQINTISEIFKNFLVKNLTQNASDVSKLSRYRREVREVARKRTPITEKRKILRSRRGGAILSVLLPLAASLISSIIA